MKKTVRLGKTKIGNRLVSVFCQIEITEGKLSITGVEGPMSNGDAVGSCGQIDMSRPEIVELAPGWNQSRLAQFWDIWGKWHLNDMRPGCQHQKTWDIKKKLTLQALTWGDKYHELRRQAENGTMPQDRFADWGRVVKQVESLTSYNSAKHPEKWNELGKRLLADGLELAVEVCNPGTPQQFETAHPTDAQLRKALGLGKTRLETSGDDTTIYINRARDCYPLGELTCLSHESLSPIREAKEEQ